MSAPEVKSLSVKDTSFMANGHKYYITEKISVVRWKEYEKLVPKLSYGLDFKRIFDALNKSYTLLNQQKFADAAINIHNIMNGIKDADDDSRFPDALWLCALIINREGEDTGVYVKEFQEQKINDWQVEGLNMLDFFQLALNTINGFKETYISFIQQQANLVMQSDLMKPMEEE